MKQIKLHQNLIRHIGDVLFISAAEICDHTNISSATWYRITKTPEVITIQQLLTVSNALRIPVRHFFYSGSKAIILKRDDYIANDYRECFYDGEAMRDVVVSRSDATWKKAAEAVDMVPSRLRKSITGATRTPVARFLTVCQTFGINPFGILIDPNPVSSAKKRAASDAGPDSNTLLHLEILSMRKEVDSLRKEVADISKKYARLMKERETVMRKRYPDGDAEEDSISIAAEDGERLDDK